jgi:hypothetical protein
MKLQGKAWSSHTLTTTCAAKLVGQKTEHRRGKLFENAEMTAKAWRSSPPLSCEIEAAIQDAVL